MRTFVFHLFLFIAIVFQASAQSQPPSNVGIGQGCTGNSPNWPNNPWPCDPELGTPGQHQYLPNDQVVFTYFAYTTDSYGNITPINGVPLKVTFYTTQYSGWHEHETSLYGRPQAIPISSNGGDGTTCTTSGAGTCTFGFQLPGLSGWYSFIVTPSVYFPIRGANFYARYAVYQQGPNNGPLLPYPDNRAINTPQTNYVDSNHVGASRFLLNNVITRVSNSSARYAKDVNTILFTPDLVNMMRGSLYDGGIADNFMDYNQYTANWQTPLWEEHGVGTEVDLLNPTTNPAPGQGITGAAAILIEEFEINGCNLGDHEPDTLTEMSQDQATNFWYSESYIHMVCGNAKLLHISPPGGGQ